VEWQPFTHATFEHHCVRMIGHLFSRVDSNLATNRTSIYANYEVFTFICIQYESWRKLSREEILPGVPPVDFTVLRSITVDIELRRCFAAVYT